MSSAITDPEAGERANTCVPVTLNGDLVVTLAQAREHLRIDATGSPPSNPEDGLITDFLWSAQAELDGWEGDLGRALLPQTWEYRAPHFTDCMVIPLPPLREVVSVQYLDQAGDTQTLDPAVYRTITGQLQPGQIRLKPNQSWPATLLAPDAVRITFEAGYDDATKVPQPIRTWIKLRVGQFFDNREAIIVGTIVNPMPNMDALVDRYRVRRVFQ